jgi:hypothetical protein
MSHPYAAKVKALVHAVRDEGAAMALGEKGRAMMANLEAHVAGRSLVKALEEGAADLREALALLREIKASDDNYLDLLERRDALLKRYAKEEK